MEGGNVVSTMIEKAYRVDYTLDPTRSRQMPCIRVGTTVLFNYSDVQWNTQSNCIPHRLRIGRSLSKASRVSNAQGNSQESSEKDRAQ